MNGYALVILIALLVSYLLQIVVTGLNVRAMPRKPPALFADSVDEETCLQSLRYAQEKVRLSILEATVELVALLLWWGMGGFNGLDLWIRSLHWDEISSGVLYLFILLLMGHLLSLPFSVYGTFVIEARYGFNKTTGATFLLDRLKGVLLLVLLMGPLLAGILGFLGYAGEQAWLYCWGITTVFLLVMQYVAPVWLMPLFNRFVPLSDGALKQAVQAYVDSVRFPVADIYEVDGSKRSAKANAFFSGFGRHRRIALFDTLIQGLTTPELVAVLAHEVGHQKYGHVRRALLISILHTGILFALLSHFLSEPALFAAFGMETMSVYAGLTFFSLLLTPLDLILGPVLKGMSRNNEYQADRFAVETIPDQSALVSALKKLSVDTLSNLTPHPLYVILHHSHPPLIERVAAIEKIVIGDHR